MVQREIVKGSSEDAVMSQCEHFTKYNVAIGPSCQRTCVYFVVLTECSGGRSIICFMGSYIEKKKKTLDLV